MADDKHNTDGHGRAGERVKKAIEDIEHELGSLVEKGVDVGDAQAFLKHASIAIEKGDIKKAVLLSVQAKEFMVKAKKTLGDESYPEPPEKAPPLDADSSEGDVSPEPEQDKIPEGKPRTDSMPANIAELNGQVRKIIDEKKQKGIDMVEAEGLYELAQKEIRLREYKYLEEHLNKAQEIANRLERKHNERIIAELNKAAEAVRASLSGIEEIGGDVSEVVRLLSVADEWSERQDFDGARDHIDSAGKMAEELKDDTLRRINKDKIMALKTELEDMIKNTSKDFPDLAAILKSAILALKDRRFEEIDGMVEEFHKVKVMDEKLYMSERLIEEIKELEKDLNVITELGIEKGNASELMFSAREGMVKERFEEVSERLSEVREMVARIKTVTARELTDTLVDESRALIGVLKENDVDISTAEELLERSVAALGSNDNLEGYRHARQTKEMLLASRKGFLKNTTEGRLEGMNIFLGDIYPLEYISPGAKDELSWMIKGVEELHLEGNILRASERLPSVEDIVSVMKTTMANHDRAEELISKANELMKTAGELDIGIEGEATRFEAVTADFRENRFAETLPPLEEINTSLETKVSGKHADNAGAMVQRAVSTVEDNADIIEDMEMFEDRIRGAKGLLESGDYEKCLEASREIIADVTAIRGEKNSREIEGRFKTANELTGELGEMGVDVRPVESLLYRAKLSWEDRDVTGTRTLIGQAVEKAVEDRISHYEGELARLKGIGIESAVSQDLTAAIRKHLSQDNVPGVKEALKELAADVEDGRTGRAKELTREYITKVKGTLVELNPLPIDLASEKETFKQAIMAIKEQRYLDGCELTIEAENDLRKAESAYYAELTQGKRTSVEELLDRAREFALDTSKVEDILGRCDELIKLDQFKDAARSVEEAETMMRGMLEERLAGMIGQELPELTNLLIEAGNMEMDVQQERGMLDEITRLKEDRLPEEALSAIRSTRELIRKAIDRTVEDRVCQLEGELERLKGIGVESTVSQDLIGVIRKHISQDNPEGVSEALKELAADVEDGRKDRAKELTREYIAKVKGTLVELNPLSIDLASEKETFKQAIMAIKEQRYLDGCELTIEAENDLRKAESAYYAELTQGKRTSVEELLDRAREFDLASPQVEGILGRCDELIKLDQFKDAARSVEEAETMIRGMLEERLAGMIGKDLSAVTNLLVEGEKLEIDVRHEREILEKVTKLKEEKRFEEAQREVRRMREDLENRINSAKIEQARTELIELEKETGRQYPELSLYMELAERAADHRDQGSLEKMLASFSGNSEERRTTFTEEKFRKRLEQADGDISTLKGLQIDIGRAEELSTEARDLLDAPDLNGTGEKLDVLRSVLDESKTKKALNRARTLIARARVLLEDLKDSGHDLDVIKEKFKEGIMAIKGEEFVEGCRIMTKTRNMLENVEGDFVMERLKETLKAVNDNVEMGADALRSEVFLYKGFYLRDKKRYDEALQFSKDAENAARLARKNFYSANMTLFLSEIADLKKEAEQFGLNTSEIDSMVTSAETYFRNNELEAGNTVSFEARQKMKDMIDGKHRELLAEEFTSLENVMEEARSIDTDLSEEAVALEELEELKEEGKYREARARVEELEDTARKKLHERKREAGHAKIGELRERLEALSSENQMDYPELGVSIEKALAALQSEDFPAFDSLVSGFEMGEEEAREQFRHEKYNEEIRQLEEMIAEMKALGLDLPSELVATLEELKKED